MKAIYTTRSPEETIELGRKLGKRLKCGDCVLLFGDLGSGKTHFTKGLATGAGVKGLIKSPTYAYVNHYKILSPAKEAPEFFYHFDLYRLKEGDDLTGMGIFEALEDVKAVSVIEWADRLGGFLPAKRAEIFLETKKNRHRISIEFFSGAMVPKKSVRQFYRQWATPVNVIRHSKMVANVAMEVAAGLIRRGEIVNMPLLESACLLHDAARVCDFLTLDRSRYPDISDKIWNRWLELRRQYHGKDHADIAAEFFRKEGFYETAEVIRVHEAALIVTHPEAFDTVEKKILYYADKRVKHDKIVSLEERFRDGRERYGEKDTPEEKALYDEAERRTRELEKELMG